LSSVLIRRQIAELSIFITWMPINSPSTDRKAAVSFCNS
jgi:hypothetical protein